MGLFKKKNNLTIEELKTVGKILYNLEEMESGTHLWNFLESLMKNHMKELPQHKNFMNFVNGIYNICSEEFNQYFGFPSTEFVLSGPKDGEVWQTILLSMIMLDFLDFISTNPEIVPDMFLESWDEKTESKGEFLYWETVTKYCIENEDIEWFNKCIKKYTKWWDDKKARLKRKF